MEPTSLQEAFGELEYVVLETRFDGLIADLPGLQKPVATDIFICNGTNSKPL